MTLKEKKLLDFIRAYRAGNDNELSPDYKEMMAHMQTKSKASIHALIKSLREGGHVRVDYRASRGVVPNKQLTPTLKGKNND